tara:strand:- start:310 stop:1452 length:1143 start_codon:yes stop_codon:yes gene_type:complete
MINVEDGATADQTQSDINGLAITTVGTISSGTWQGTAIAHDYIGLDAIDGTNIADDSINSEHYVDGSIDTAHIADDQVTYAKIQNVTNARMLGNNAGSDGVITEMTAANVRSFLDLEIGTDVLAQQTIGIANDNLVEIDDADAANGDYAKFTANGLEGRSASEVRSDINVDVAGTDNSTNVTLAGTPDYITISGQEITRNQIDLAADVTGVLPSANLDSDTAHLSGSQTFTGTKTFNHIRPMVIEHSDPGTGVGDFKAADVAFFGSTTSMTKGKCYYLNDSGGWTITNADAEADASGLLAIALGDESDVDGMLLRGMVTPYALGGTDDYGKKVYLREQDGILTTAIPTTSGSIVRIVGYMLHDSDDAIFFCPDNTYVELA